MKITKRLENKIRKCPKVYLVGCWAKYGVLDFSWTGKWHINENGIPVPIVYYYNDHNGEYEEYQRIPIYNTTTGMCITWSFNKDIALRIAKDLNEHLV